MCSVDALSETVLSTSLGPASAPRYSIQSDSDADSLPAGDARAGRAVAQEALGSTLPSPARHFDGHATLLAGAAAGPPLGLAAAGSGISLAALAGAPNAAGDADAASEMPEGSRLPELMALLSQTQLSLQASVGRFQSVTTSRNSTAFFLVIFLLC